MASQYGPLSKAEQFEIDRQAGDRILRRKNLKKSLPLVIATPVVVIVLVELGAHLLNGAYRHSSLNPAHTTSPAAAAKMTLLPGGAVTPLALVLALTATIGIIRAVWGGSQTHLEAHEAARVGRHVRQSNGQIR